MPHGHVAGDRQAEARAAVVAAAGVVEPDEPLEDPFPVGLRAPRHRRRPPRARPGRRRAARTPRTAERGVPLGVVEQIASTRRQLAARAGHLSRAGDARASPARSPRPAAPASSRTSAARSTRRRPRPLPRVQPGQQQQVGGEVLEPYGVLDRAVARPADPGARRPPPAGCAARRSGCAARARRRRRTAAAAPRTPPARPASRWWSGPAAPPRRAWPGSGTRRDRSSAAVIAAISAPDALHRPQRPPGHQPGHPADDREQQRAGRPASPGATVSDRALLGGQRGARRRPWTCPPSGSVDLDGRRTGSRSVRRRPTGRRARRLYGGVRRRGDLAPRRSGVVRPAASPSSAVARRRRRRRRPGRRGAAAWPRPRATVARRPCR